MPISVFKAVTHFEKPKVRASGEVVSLSADLEEQKRVNRELRQKVADANAELAVERQAKRELRDSATDVTRRITKRAAVTATRETAVMGAEAIPFWGTTVIVAATALELNDLCQTAKDMNELEDLLNPDAVTDDETLTICTMKVPSRKELWAKVVDAPGAAWTSARDLMPDLSEMRDFDLPDVNWPGLGEWIVGGATSVETSIRDSAVAGTETASDTWAQFKDWWNDKPDEPE